MPIEGYKRGTPDLYPRGSDKCLSPLTSSPRMCRACRPTTRRHFAHTAIAMLCEMAKRRLLRCLFGLPGSSLPCTVSPSACFGHRSARRGPKEPRCSTGGGWSAGSAGRSHALRVPSDGVSNTRPIVLAGCGLLNTRRDTRLGALPPTNPGRGTHTRWNSPQASASKQPASRRGFSHFTRAEDTPESRAGSASGQGDPLCGRPNPADLDRSLAARTHECVGSGGIQPILACSRFRRHRVRCFYGTGGESWRDEGLRGSSSLRLCG
jgi:hypothetical protein